MPLGMDVFLKLCLLALKSRTK